jgi:type IV secretory pathway VirB10-like protein
MDKERMMQNGDAFLKAYQVLQTLAQTEKKNGIRWRSFGSGPRTVIFGPWNPLWKVNLVKVSGGIAILFTLTVLGVGLLHHFLWEPKDRAKSAAIAAYAAASAPIGQKDSAAIGHGGPAGRMTDSSSGPSGAATAYGLPAHPPAPKPGRSDVTAAAEASQQRQWEAVDKRNPDSLRAYLDKNRRGLYSAEALQRLGALLQAQQAQQARAAEQNAWNSVDLRSEEGIQHFLARYPDGNYAAAAQELLHRLTHQKKAESRRAPMIMLGTQSPRRISIRWKNI